MKLKQLFDYQRFMQNPGLKEMTDGVYKKYLYQGELQKSEPVPDAEMEAVAAAVWSSDFMVVSYEIDAPKEEDKCASFIQSLNDLAAKSSSAGVMCMLRPNNPSPGTKCTLQACAPKAYERGHFFEMFEKSLRCIGNVGFGRRIR